LIVVVPRVVEPAQRLAIVNRGRVGFPRVVAGGLVAEDVSPAVFGERRVVAGPRLAAPRD
jgi:hypothetical protein